MYKNFNSAVLASAMFLSACATNTVEPSAASLSVKERITINAPAEKVWIKVNNFGDLGAWHPAVGKTKITSGVSNQVDAVRLLTLQDGGTIEEKLTAYDDSNMFYSYVINKGVLPVSGYASTIQVLPLNATTTEVVWAGNFKRKDLSANPSKGSDDDAALNTVTAVYKGGLDNLKKIME